MNNYPFEIKNVAGGWAPWFKVTDAQKQVVYYMKETQPDPIRKGTAPLHVYGDESQQQPLFKIQRYVDRDAKWYETQDWNGTKLGTIKKDGKTANTVVLDANDQPLGQITVQNEWRIWLTGWFRGLDPLIVSLFPIKYTVEWQNQPVLLMRERLSIIDRYYTIEPLNPLADPDLVLAFSSLLINFWPI